ncbi:MAG: glycosyltransferase family 2 protein [bacterium]
MKFSIVIPNYNGILLLKQYFASIYSYAHHNNIHDIIVVDDCSSDDSVAYIQSNFPNTKIISNRKNLGFGETCNIGVKASSGDYVFLFNTDIEIRDLDLALIQSYIIKNNFFAITFKSLYEDKKTFREGAKQFRIKTGLPFVHHNPKQQKKDDKGNWISIYAVGGHCIVHKEKFLALNGFLDIYSPFYWEDMDIGYRAHKKGWITYYDENLIVIHNCHSTIKTSFQKKYINFIKLRNRILFMLNNYSPGERLYKFYPGMIIRSIENTIKCDFSFFAAWRAATRIFRSL